MVYFNIMSLNTMIFGIKILTHLCLRSLIHFKNTPTAQCTLLKSSWFFFREYPPQPCVPQSDGHIQYTQPSLHDATRWKHRKLNLSVSWESADVPKRLKFTSNKKPRTQATCCFSNKTTATHCRSHSYSSEAPARATLALIQTKPARPPSIINDES